MTSQARIGSVVLILLVGCILAIPHFRHPTQSLASKAENADETDTASTLQLKVEPNSDSDEADKDTNGAKAKKKQANPPKLLREKAPLKRHSVLMQTPAATPPASLEREEWKFPPVSTPPDVADRRAPASNRFERIPGSPEFIERAELTERRPRPARFTSEEFRAPAGANRQSFPSPEAFASRLVPRKQDGASSTTPEQSAYRGNGHFQRQNNRTQNTSQLTARTTTRSVAEPPLRDDTALHRVVNGDTLENLAQQYYGDRRKAMLIFESNRQALFNPAILPLGLDLKIPQPTK